MTLILVGSPSNLVSRNFQKILSKLRQTYLEGNGTAMFTLRTFLMYLAKKFAMTEYQRDLFLM